MNQQSVISDRKVLSSPVMKHFSGAAALFIPNF